LKKKKKSLIFYSEKVITCSLSKRKKIYSSISIKLNEDGFKFLVLQIITRAFSDNVSRADINELIIKSISHTWAEQTVPAVNPTLTVPLMSLGCSLNFSFSCHQSTVVSLHQSYLITELMEKGSNWIHHFTIAAVIFITAADTII